MSGESVTPGESGRPGEDDSPGETLGVVGGGQLGRMLAEAASPLGVELVVLDPTPDCPAALPARDQIVGDFDDPDGVRELAERADRLTYEIELADPDLLADVSAATGVAVHPAPETLRMIQDKLTQNRWLADHDIPVPPFRRVDDAADLAAAMEELGSPVMLKARRGGYDGRGNLPVAAGDDFADALAQVGGSALAESHVDFARELSVVGARGPGGIETFPVVETVHREEILRESVVPARTDPAVRERARAVGREVIEALEGRGVFAVELFETRAGEILVNEIAPRPHNSGHWTIEGAVTSQFEQHVRAVTGRPLGATDARGPCVSANLLGDVDESRPATPRGFDEVLATPGISLHWYGKHEARPLRKMGHVTGIETESVAGTEDEEERVESDEADPVELDDAEGVDPDEAERVEPDEAERVEPDDAERVDRLLTRVREARDAVTFRDAG